MTLNFVLERRDFFFPILISRKVIKQQSLYLLKIVCN
jgi:hypothetical protein